MFKHNMGKYYYSTKITNEIGFYKKKLKQLISSAHHWVWKKLAIESLFLAMSANCFRLCAIPLNISFCSSFTFMRLLVTCICCWAKAKALVRWYLQKSHLAYYLSIVSQKIKPPFLNSLVFVHILLYLTICLVICLDGGRIVPWIAGKWNIVKRLWPLCMGCPWSKI